MAPALPSPGFGRKRHANLILNLANKRFMVQLNPGGLRRGRREKVKEGERTALSGWKSREIPRWYKYSDPVSRERKAEGKRQTMSETFVPAFLGSGGRLLSGIRVEKLKREHGRWSVLALQDKRPVQIDAEAVFLCAGAVQTPALLRRSGILKNIGNSLAMHPTIKVAAVFDEEINTLEPEVPAYQVTEFSPRLCIGCSVSSRAYLALAMTDYPELYEKIRSHRTRMAVFFMP